MKKLLLTLTLCCSLGITLAQSPKREFRATWLATVWGIDWPKTQVTTTGNTTQINAQKSELITILDKLVAANMNAVCFQIRPASDALYNSAYEPWSSYLTGSRGKDPGYDPLAFALEECHKRGIELHAWINPFRYETQAGAYGSNDVIRKNHPEWVLDYPNKSDGTKDISILDPGNPNVRNYIVSVIEDIITKYDVDGIVFDDYFYAYSGTSTTLDSYSQNLYKPSSTTLSNWRRANINATIKGVYDMIQADKPWINFGVSPFGIWTTSSSVASSHGLTLPAGIVGSNMYEQIYCDPVAWLEEGTIDYISPQLYWTTFSSGQDYDVLCPWWSNLVETYTNRNGARKFHFYSSMSLSGMENPANAPAQNPAIPENLHELKLYTMNGGMTNGLSQLEMQKAAAATNWGASEIGLQIDRNRNSDKMGAPGSIMYNTTSFLKTNFVSYLATNKHQKPALTPARDWKNATVQPAVKDITLTNTTLTWSHTATNIRYAIYAYPKGEADINKLSTSTYLLGISYTKSFDLSALGSTIDNYTIGITPLDRYSNEHEAAFFNTAVIEPPTPGTTSLTTLWSKTQAQSGYLVTGNLQRSMAYYDGKLYIPKQSTSATFDVIDANSGSKLSTQSVGTFTSGWSVNNASISNDGQLLLGSSLTGSNAITVTVSDRTVGGITSTNSISVSGFGRSDFFSYYGDFNTAEGGYLLALSNTSQNAVKVPVTNGTFGTPIWIANTALPKSTSAKALTYDGTSFFAQTSATIPTLHRFSNGSLQESFGAIAPTTPTASGMDYFIFKGRKFLAVATDLYGSIDLFEITDGLANAIKISSTPALGSSPNGAITLAICSAVKTDQVEIFVMAPNNGIAAYALTIAETPTDVETPQVHTPHVYNSTNGISIEVNTKSNIQVYSVSGQLIKQLNTSETVEIPLNHGAYIVRINNDAIKIIR